MEGFEYGAYRKRFHELRDELLQLETAGDDFSEQLEEIVGLQEVVAGYTGGRPLASEIKRWREKWLKGGRVYDIDEFITRQELERVIKRDCYYLRREFVHESFLDDDLVTTMITPDSLVDTWISRGLPTLEACPWSPPPRYDYKNEQDCRTTSERACAIKIVSIRKFLNSHSLPVPTEIFPDEATNTSCKLSRTEYQLGNLRKKRSEEKQRFEFKEPSRNNDQAYPEANFCLVSSFYINKTKINNTTNNITNTTNNYHVSTISIAGKPSDTSGGAVQGPHDHVVTGPTADAPVAEAQAEEPAGIAVKNTKPSLRRGRKPTLDDMECLRIYRQHYQEGKQIEAIAKEYNWLNSPFADTPKFETAKSRINKALVRGRELTPHHARPTNDKAGRE